MKKILFILYIILILAAFANVHLFSQNVLTPAPRFPNPVPTLTVTDSVLSNLYKGITGQSFVTYRSPKYNNLTGLLIYDPTVTDQEIIYLNSNQIADFRAAGTVFGDLNTNTPYITVNGAYTYYSNTSTGWHPLATDSTSFYANNSDVAVIGPGSFTFLQPLRFNGTQTTGSGTALLGTNCPALGVGAPYTWIKIWTSDGSIAYIPCWK